MCLAVGGLDAQEFSYGFANVPDDVTGPAGSVHELVIDMTLTTSGLEGDKGPQGWSAGVRNRGMDIKSITTDGTAGGTVPPEGKQQGGFEVFEIIDENKTPNAGPLAGEGAQGQGCVQAVVLSFTQPITLDPNQTDSIGRVTYEATVPAGGGEASVEFIDGLQGAGQPVQNNVTQEGETIVPSLGSATISLIEKVGPGTALLLGTDDDSSVDDLVICATEGATEFWAAAYIGPEVPEEAPANGAQGWSIGVEHSASELEVVEVTTAETATAEIMAGGFEVTEIVDPARQDPAGREGWVSAIVLSFTMPITLPADETSKVARARYEVENASDTLAGSIEYADGLKGGGQPVVTVLTIEGETVNAAIQTSLNVSHSQDVCAPPPPRFLRGDANNDGKVNIADPIYTINERVGRGPEFACEKAADSNADDMVDLSDAMYTIEYRFLGGTEPPAPFIERPAAGEQCGEDPNHSEDLVLTCEDANCS